MKKIMFNDKFGLTDAVLSGSKTQTRRKAVKVNAFYGTLGYGKVDYKYNKVWLWHDNGETFLEFNSKYMLGEIVAVAQSYKDALCIERCDCSSYSTTINNKEVWLGWDDAGYNNKLFVKSQFMPHQIKITGLRIERLQDISDEDCIKEGVCRGDFTNTWDKYYITIGSECNKTFKTPREAYAHLIDKVSGKGTWANNPWVWVYDFELIK